MQSLADYRTELKARGFDGFTDADLNRYINRAYHRVARKFQWYWEHAEVTASIVAGTDSITTATLPNFKSLKAMYITTTGHRRKLEVYDSEKFMQWLAEDHTLTAARGETTHYYVYGGKVYFIPVPSFALNYTAQYTRRMTDLAGDADVPILPTDTEEAIFQYALAQCHRRSNEPDRARDEEQRVDEIFDEMLDEDDMLMAEQQERIRPDNQWS